MSFSLNSYDYKCYEAPDHVTDTERFPHSNAQRRPLALLQLLQFKFPISNTFRQDRSINFYVATVIASRASVDDAPHSIGIRTRSSRKRSVRLAGVNLGEEKCKTDADSKLLD